MDFHGFWWILRCQAGLRQLKVAVYTPPSTPAAKKAGARPAAHLENLHSPEILGLDQGDHGRSGTEPVIWDVHRWIWTHEPWKQPELWQLGQAASRLWRQDARSTDPASIRLDDCVQISGKTKLKSLCEVRLQLYTIADCMICVYMTIWWLYVMVVINTQSQGISGWIGVTLTHGMQDGPIVLWLRCKRNCQLLKLSASCGLASLRRAQMVTKRAC